MSAEEAWTPSVNQSFVLWLNHHRRRHEGRLPAVTSPPLCLHSRLFLRLLRSSIHFCVQENTHFACPLPVLRAASFCGSLHACRAEAAGVHFCLNWPLMQRKAKPFGVLLICFFFFLFVFKNQKYCSFKYCALHRIFCHKLVNIYIFFFNIQTYTFIYTGQ